MSINVFLLLSVSTQQFGCEDAKSTTATSCIICRPSADEGESAYLDCSSEEGMVDSMCQETERECQTVSACCELASVGATGCETTEVSVPDIEPVTGFGASEFSGDLAYSAKYLEETHLFGLDTTTDVVYQLTRSARSYFGVSVSPNGDRLLFTEKLADNTHQIGLLEAGTEQVTMISSPGCDVDATSLGWFNDTFVGFSMKCPGDQYFQARLVNTYNLNDSTIPPITQQMGDVRNVSPILNTTFFLYALQFDDCAVPGCNSRSEIWFGHYELPELQCRITDTNSLPDEPERAFSGRERMLGDAHPHALPNASEILFSRTVGNKPQGPDGHLDVWRKSINLNAFISGQAECGDGLATSVTSTLESDRWYREETGLQFLQEYYPFVSLENDGSTLVSHYFVGRDYASNGQGTLFLAAANGQLAPLTSPQFDVQFASWIQRTHNLTGSR